MMNTKTVEKPETRGALRKFLGREYFILKRRWQWWKDRRSFAKPDESVITSFSVIKHRSFLLRPLKDVDMILQHNKVKNLQLAIAHLDDIVIRPGEVFSIWKNVGRPSKAKGYLDGLVLHNGKIDRDTGGGLCQLGNLLYWMTLHTPLTIHERWRHGYDVFPDINRTIPFACGATLSYNYVDLQIKNETPDTFRIKLWLDAEYLNGEIRCTRDLATTYEIIETDHCFMHQWWGGYTRHNKIWKKITHHTTGQETTELVAENSAIMMYNPLLEGSKV